MINKQIYRGMSITIISLLFSSNFVFAQNKANSNNMNTSKSIENKDTDGDGIIDVYENMINEGKITLANGEKLSGKLNLKSSDTDGDGISDGEELQVVNNNGKLTLIYNSDPTNKDTDGDGFIDSKENKDRRLLWDVSDRDLGILAGLSYSKDRNDPQYTNYFSLMQANLGGKLGNEMKGWKVLDYQGGLEGAVGFSATTYVENKSKNIVISYRGSNDSKDWFDHIKFLIDTANKEKVKTSGILHPQANQAINYAKNKIAQYKKDGYKVYITGHSLGGHLALVAAGAVAAEHPEYIEKVNTFDALGAMNFYPKYIQNGLTNLNTKITNFLVEGEFIDSFGYSANFNRVLVKNINDDIFHKHYLHYILPILEPKGRGTQWNTVSDDFLAKYPTSPAINKPVSEGYHSTERLLTIEQRGGYIARYYITWDEIYTDKNGNKQIAKKEWYANGRNKMLGYSETISFPDNVINIKVREEIMTGLLWNKWKVGYDKSNIQIDKKLVITGSGTVWNPKFKENNILVSPINNNVKK